MSQDFQNALKMAGKYGLLTADAGHAALALKLKVPIATFDGEFKKCQNSVQYLNTRFSVFKASWLREGCLETPPRIYYGKELIEFSGASSFLIFKFGDKGNLENVTSKMLRSSEYAYGFLVVTLMVLLAYWGLYSTPTCLSILNSALLARKSRLTILWLAN